MANKPKPGGKNTRQLFQEMREAGEDPVPLQRPGMRGNTQEQYLSILWFLKHHKHPITSDRGRVLSDIAPKLSVKPSLSSLSTRFGELEVGGWIERDTRGKRTFLVRLIHPDKVPGPDPYPRKPAPEATGIDLTPQGPAVRRGDHTVAQVAAELLSQVLAKAREDVPQRIQELEKALEVALERCKVLQENCDRMRHQLERAPSGTVAERISEEERKYLKDLEKQIRMMEEKPKP